MGSKRIEEDQNIRSGFLDACLDLLLILTGSCLFLLCFFAFGSFGFIGAWTLFGSRILVLGS